MQGVYFTTALFVGGVTLFRLGAPLLGQRVNKADLTLKGISQPGFGSYSKTAILLAVDSKTKGDRAWS